MIKNNLKMEETNVKLDTLKKLIKQCVLLRFDYSQLTINLVQEAEEVFAFKGKGLEDLLNFRDNIDNILEVIDKTKVYDYDALVLLQVLVNEKLTWKGTENKKELTAVEFLEERYNDPILKDNFITKEEFQRAKEIEKKQRIKDLHNGFNTARIYPGILYQDTELSTSFDELK